MVGTLRFAHPTLAIGKLKGTVARKKRSGLREGMIPVFHFVPYGLRLLTLSVRVFVHPFNVTA